MSNFIELELIDGNEKTKICSVNFDLITTVVPIEAGKRTVIMFNRDETFETVESYETVKKALRLAPAKTKAKNVG